MELAGTSVACVLGLALVAGACAAAGETAAGGGALKEVPFPTVRVDDAFWAPRIEAIQKTTIPDLLQIAADQGKLDNFAIVAGRKQGKLALHNSPDSDVYKLLEAAAYTLAWRQDDALARRVEELVSAIAAAQADSGYLNTQYMLPPEHPASPPATARAVKRYGYGPAQQWQGGIEQWPKGIGQLYCAGHLFEAAAAHFRATGKRSFLDVAMRLADHVDRQFPKGRAIDYADHPQAGIGLVKLYEATGERRYLELADRIVHGGRHARPVDLGEGESHKPLTEQRTAFGHAVRTGYLYAAATDLCRHLARPATRAAVESLWRSLIDRRVYLIGGVGNGTAYEQHGPDWLLPNDTCYCECCANIALAQWTHRLNLLTGEAAYADVVEIVAYNGGLSGISLDGTKYFYANKLAAGRDGRTGQHSGVRKRYLFCCPAKLPGFVAGIGRWAFAVDDGGLYVNLYVGGSASVSVGGRDVRIVQQTRYPWDGGVRLTVQPPGPMAFDLCLRLPGWTRGRPLPSDLYRSVGPEPGPVTLKVNGQAVPTPQPRKGYLRIGREWRPGDTVELHLPMPVRRAYAHGNVQADRGRVALMRGPIVYCLEATDHTFDVLNAVLPKDAKLTPEHRDDLLGGVTVLRGRGLADGEKAVDLTAVPYYAWQNRGIGEMAVWLIEDASLCRRLPKPDPGNRATIATPSASCEQVGANSLDALNDGVLPKHSGDTSLVRMAWWPRKGSTEWVQYDFRKPETIDRIAVYWFQDHPRGGCRLPASWRLLYRAGGKWLPVPNAGEYVTARDRLVELKFDPLKTTALRIEVQLQPGFSGGICEWRIEPCLNIDG